MKSKTNVSTSTLVGLAILKSNADVPASGYIDYFSPFVLDSIARSDSDTVNAFDTRASIQESFGLVLPIPVIEILLKRASRDGYLERRNRTYTRRSDPLRASVFPKKRAEAQRHNKLVVSSLRRFAKNKDASKNWSDSDAEEKFVGFLRERSFSIVAAAVNGDAPVQTAPLRSDDGYLVHLFVLECFEREPLVFEAIEIAAKGSMLADALYFSVEQDLKEKTKKLSIYLDTPLLLNALGYAETSVDTQSAPVVITSNCTS